MSSFKSNCKQKEEFIPAWQSVDVHKSVKISDFVCFCLFAFGSAEEEEYYNKRYSFLIFSDEASNCIIGFSCLSCLSQFLMDW